jgi:23S rRNA pseudouridine1911/1915/1917 synthase
MDAPPDEEHVALVVEEEHDGLRLDHFLTSVLPGHTRSQIQRLIKDGHVTSASGGRIRASTPVKAGERFAVDLPEVRAAGLEPEALPLRIVYEDPDVVVLDKPAGMVVHPGAGHAGGTVVNALLHHVKDLSGIGGEARPGIVHRLDRGTSGLMVVAKHDRAHEALAAQFEERHVEKEYTALIWGVLSPGRRIEEPIGRDPNNRQKMSTKARRARTAVSRITWAEPFPGVCLVGVGIATGRTHQIRVHLSGIGHPIVGDALYGGIHRHVPPRLRGVQKLDRPFLHASRLSFAHPLDGRKLEFRSELPADLTAVVERLRYDLEHLAY